MSEPSENTLEPKNCAKIALPKAVAQFSKTDVRYWKDRIFKQEKSSNWSVEIYAAGQRHKWSLDTPNKESAATRARDIYLSIKGNGWEGTLQKYRPALASPKKRQNATVGEFLNEVKAKADGDPKTLEDYSKALRKIVSDVFEIDAGNEKFDYKTGGYQSWLGRVHAVKLLTLTPDKIQAWKRTFLARAGNDLIQLRRAKVSFNSFVRRAKSLFAPGIVRHLSIVLPSPLPFEGVEFEPRQSLKYRSEIDVAELIQAANAELVDKESEVFKIFLLGVMVGLRRNEIDLLEWSSFKWDQGVIRIEPTSFFHPKTEDSIGDVPVDGEVMEIFRGYRARAKGIFVIESKGKPKPGITRLYYRCQKQFKALNRWLRQHGITEANKPLHTLRKEFGSKLAEVHGIFAASTALRHADISITSAFYADAKARISVGLGHHLKAPLPSTPENVVTTTQVA
jgi:integrase